MNRGGSILVTRDMNYKELFISVEINNSLYYEHFIEFNNKGVKYIPFYICSLE